MTVRLYKDGDCMAIETDCDNEEEFIEQCSRMLDCLIDEHHYDGDWYFQLERWLPQIVEIACAYRGYKTGAKIKRVISAGDSNSLGILRHTVDGTRVKSEFEPIDTSSYTSQEIEELDKPT